MFVIFWFQRYWNMLRCWGIINREWALLLQVVVERDGVKRGSREKGLKNYLYINGYWYYEKFYIWYITLTFQEANKTEIISYKLNRFLILCWIRTGTGFRGFSTPLPNLFAGIFSGKRISPPLGCSNSKRLKTITTNTITSFLANRRPVHYDQPPSLRGN